MNNLTASQVSPSVSQHLVNHVYQYACSVVDASGDVQTLLPAFSSLPDSSDWDNWLSGWFSCGYSLQSQPRLVRVI